MASLSDALLDNARLWGIAAAHVQNVSKRRRLFMWRRDVNFTVKDYFQPRTAAQCVAYNTNGTLPKTDMIFPVSKSMCSPNRNSSLPYQLPQGLKIVSDFHEGVGTTPQLHFLELSQEDFGNHTTAAIATIPPIMAWRRTALWLSC